MNLLTMVVTAAVLAHSLTFAKVAQLMGDNLPASYVWTLDKCGAVCDYLHTAWSQRR